MSLDLNKLENKLDEALIKETTETLTKFLNDKRMTNNEQQTTLQILINGLIDRKKNIIENADSMPNDMLEGGVMAFESAIDLAQSLLQMEKERIIDAHYEGQCNQTEGYPLQIAEQYYNETYGDDKQ